MNFSGQAFSLILSSFALLVFANWCFSFCGGYTSASGKTNNNTDDHDWQMLRHPLDQLTEWEGKNNSLLASSWSLHNAGQQYTRWKLTQMAKIQSKKGQADTRPELLLCIELGVVFSLHAVGGYLWWQCCCWLGRGPTLWWGGWPLPLQTKSFQSSFIVMIVDHKIQNATQPVEPDFRCLNIK